MHIILVYVIESTFIKIHYYINLHYNLSDRRLLRHKRAEHIEAAKKIVSINSLAKQRDVLNALFAKLFSVSVKYVICFISALLHFLLYGFNSHNCDN